MLMVAIALLAGFVAAGSLWVGWDLVSRLGAVLSGWRQKRRLQAEADALLPQAEEPSETARPK